MKHRKKKGQKKTPEDKKGQNTPITGTMSLSYRGVGYVRTEQFEEDIEVTETALNTALHGDTVQVVLIKKPKKGELHGRVVKIIDREKTAFVGTIKHQNGAVYLAPDDQRVYRNILITNADQFNDLQDSVKVFVEMEEWNDPRSDPRGNLVHILGEQGEHNVEMNSIVLEHGFRVEFPDRVKKEAEKIQANAKKDLENEVSNRRDIRGITTLTIDPWDAKDFDDALSIKKLDDGWYEIGVHIADVSHYVRPGSELDKEARRRGFSVYLVDRTIPMLPEELSNDICSLNPEEDKLAFSAIFIINDSGTIKDRWFGRTVIRSDKRFAYEEAQESIDANDRQYSEELSVFNTVAKKMAEERFKKGAIDFETQEVEIELNENNEPKKIYKKERLDAHKLIEEWMLLANREVAKFVADKQKKNQGEFIYRVHDIPNPDKIDSLALFTEALGHHLKRGENGSIKSTDLNKLLESIKGETGEDMVKVAAIRSMAKAAYSTKNIGHYGLAFDYYTHFTSPIRRYPDLVVHRILDVYVSGKKASEKMISQLKKIAIETSEKELDAAQAERESIKFKQVEYMLDHIGETFTGVVSGVSERGLFIAEESTGAEGLVRLRDMDNDFYTLNESGYTLVGERTGQKYQLGDEVKVRVEGGDLEKKQLDYKLVN